MSQSVSKSKFKPHSLEYFRSLRNTVLKYDAPLEPLGVEDWEILKLSLRNKIKEQETSKSDNI